MPYLTFDELKEASAFSPSDWDELNTRRPNTFARWEKTLRSRKIDDKLRRRYAVPFGVVPPAEEPNPSLVPEAAKDWLVAYLDDRLLRSRRNAGSEDLNDVDISNEAQEATTEIENAANPEQPGHPELPLRSDLASSSGIVKGGPLVASNTTIYGFYDEQAALRNERGW